MASRAKSSVRPERPRLEQLKAGSLELVDDAVIDELDCPDPFVDSESAEFVELLRSRIGAGSFANSEWYRTRWVDLEFTGTDLANARLIESGLERITAEGCRATGLQLAGATLTDLTFTNCLLDLVNFRTSKFRRVSFTDCKLSGSDWAEATLDRVTFTRCDLTDAEFSNTSHKQVLIDDCVIDGLRGITSLSGATIAGADPLLVANLFAQAHRVTLEG